jgi:hypothetical protein
MGRRGNGEGSITQHKKSGLYMALAIQSRHPRDQSGRQYTARPVKRWQRSSRKR